MTDSPQVIMFADLLTGWNEPAEVHRAALTDGWSLAVDLARLHGEAIAAFSERTVPTPSEREQAALLVAAHAYNVFIGALGTTIRGQFDVAAYLMRPLLEGWVVFVAVARDDEYAAKFMAHRLHTNDAWRRTKDELKKAGETELVQDLDRIFRDEQDATDDLAHVSVLHADKLVTRESEELVPHLAGAIDHGEATRMWRGALVQERRLLGFMRGIFGPVLDEDWQQRFESLQLRFHAWMQETDEDNKS